MKLINGVWLPSETDDLANFVRARSVNGVGVYQYDKLMTALEYVRNWRNAIDVGAHVGLWSMWLTKSFQNVYAFEPVELHRECFKRNVTDAELLPFALGEEAGKVRLTTGVLTTGDTRVTDDGDIEAEMRPLDSFDIPDVDFIKLDCEGYELFALKGGEKTIDKYHPAICVEQKVGKARQYGIKDTAAVQWLTDKGYELKAHMRGDYILQWTP